MKKILLLILIFSQGIKAQFSSNKGIVSVTSPLFSAQGIIGVQPVSHVQNGYMLANDKIKLDMYPNVFGSITSNTSALIITGGTNSVLSNTSFSIAEASPSQSGLLSASDKNKLNIYPPTIGSLSSNTSALSINGGINALLTNTTLSIAEASTSESGLMSASDKSKLNVYPNTKGNLTSGTAALTISGGTGATLNNTSFSISEASTTQSGLMSASDKSKLNVYPTITGNLTSGTAALTITGGSGSALSNASFSIAEASTTQSGLMSASDKSKLNIYPNSTGNLSSGTAALTISGGSGSVLSNASFSIAEASTTQSGLMSASDKTKLNIYPNSIGNLTSGTAALTITGGSGSALTNASFSINEANTTQSGLMSATDKTNLDKLVGLQTKISTNATSITLPSSGAMVIFRSLTNFSVNLPDPSANDGLRFVFIWQTKASATFNYPIYYAYSTAGVVSNTSWGPTLAGGGGNASFFNIVADNGQWILFY